MNYYCKKILSLLVTLVLVSLITFAVFQILPGNPVDIILGVDADPAQAAAMEQRLGLDRPIAERYLSWVAGVFCGDLGSSLRYQQPVTQILSSSLEVTASLALLTMLWTLGIGIPVGIWLAQHSKKSYGVAVSMISQVSLSIPTFCMAIFLIHIFSVRLKWLPSIGFVSFSKDPGGWFRSLLLPSFSLALGTAAILIRYVRVSILNQKSQDYTRTARSKGLGQQRILYGHVLRNSLIPVITILGVILADVLGGSIIIENVFSLPGIGKMVAEAVNSRDLPLIQGLVLYLAVIVVICNFAVDLIYSLIDPRMKIKKEER